MLQIDFYLGSPVVLDFPIHLDAIIDHVWAYDVKLDRELTADPRQYQRSGVFKETGGMAHASIGLLVGAVSVEYWHKRFELDGAEMIDFGGKKEQARIGSGPYKNYQMPLRAITAEKITFYAEGNENEIARLARLVPHIGKKHAYGYGRVIGVDCKHVEPSQLVFVRALPTCLFPKPIVRSQKIKAGWRTPYWYRADYTECWVPVKFVFSSTAELLNFVKGGD